MPTITGYENRIREYTAARSINVSRSKVQRLALKLHKRQARMWDEDLERIFMHSDPTPQSAIKRARAKEELAKRGVVFA